MVPGAVDCHLHIVDAARFPYSDAGGYHPGPDEQAPREVVADTLAHHGLSSCVVVQLSGYGMDNAPLLDAVDYSGGRWRVIAGLGPRTGTAELEALSRRGVVGGRFNVVNFGRDALAVAVRLLDQFADLGFVADIQCPAADFPSFRALLAAARCPVVLDHLGLPDVTRPLDDPGFASVLAFGRDGGYVKFSGAFRASRTAFPHADLDPFVAALKGAFAPEQRVFGSDFPFVNLARRPEYADTLAMLARWLPDEAERRTCLVEVPRRLFRIAT